jgi:hypothetical protein
MVSVQEFEVWGSRADDSPALLDVILALERPDRIDAAAARRALDRLLSPRFALRTLRVCVVCMLVTAVAAGVGLVGLAS